MYIYSVFHLLITNSFETTTLYSLSLYLNYYAFVLFFMLFAMLHFVCNSSKVISRGVQCRSNS